MIPRRAGLLSLIACASIAAAAGAEGLAPAHVEWMRPPALEAHGAVAMPDVRGDLRSRVTPFATRRTAAYPTYFWPLERHLHDGLVAVNYVDHDPGGGLLDYSGGTHTYDTHRGIDYTLYNFRLMDRGCAIRAASDGVVEYQSAPSPFDRHCDFNWPDDGNWLWVNNGDGTYSEYYHLRANSVTVQIGDPVIAGQVLGLVGSSGYSTGPHLHFETGDYFGGPYAARDPYTGTSNALPSLWYVQDDYEGDDPLWFADLGVFSQSQTGGSVFNTTYCDISERLSQPVLFGANEPVIGIWVQFQGNAGDPFRIEVRRPDNSVYAGFDDTIGSDAQFSWFWAYWFWDGNIAPADYGTWKVRALSDGVLSREVEFAVGAATAYGPRFWPRAGRSFRINGTVQKDTLRRSPLGGPVTFSLLNAPSFVTLTSDSILEVGAVSNQPNRSLYFQALAVDGAARRDTAWFHIVDMSKPNGQLVGVEPPVPHEDGVELELAGASPSSEGTVIRYRVPDAARVSLGIYDLRGRRVRSLVEGETARGGQTVTEIWDGCDEAGHSLPGGIYFAQLRAGDARRMLKVVRLP